MNPKTEIKIFIGYAREDESHAERIYNFLKKISGVIPWMDKKNLLPGANWEEEIMTAIEESRFVLMLLSSQSVNKQGYVQKEALEILDRLKRFPPGEIFIIPVRIDYCTPRYRALKKLHWVDLFGQTNTKRKLDDGFKNGLKKIKELITFEQKKIVKRDQGEALGFETSTQNISSEDVKKIENQLSEDLLKNLSEYAKWLRYQEFLPVKGQYEQVLKSLPNWTRQANGKWLEELLSWEIVKLKNGKMVFTILGIKLLEMIT